MISASASASAFATPRAHRTARPVVALLGTLAATLLLASTGDPARAAAPPDGSDGGELPATLGLDDALRLFRKRGFDLLLAEATVESARGDLAIASAVANPSLTGGLYRAFFTPGLFESEYGWFADVSDNSAIADTLSGKRGLRQEVARRALAAAKMSRLDAQRTLEFQVKQAYAQAVLARTARDFARDVASSSSQTFELNQVRYKAGAISEADVAKVETARLEAEQALDQTEQALRQAKVALAFLLGMRRTVPDFQVEPEAIKFVVPPRLAAASVSALVDQAYERRPDLKAIALQRQRADAQLRLARRLRFPDLSLTLGYSQQGSSSGAAPAAPSPTVDAKGDPLMNGIFVAGNPTTPVSPPTFQVSITGQLPVLYRQEGEIVKAEADVRTQAVLRDKLEAQVVSDVENAFAAFSTSRRLVERMETRLLDRARRTRDLVAIQYQKGSASLLEFLDAQRTFIATNVEYLQDLTNYWTAVFQLEQAVGVELR